ncbi:MAG: cysteine hydrolase family protein [Candidatus Eiseniibacteriota bacterium]
MSRHSALILVDVQANMFDPAHPVAGAADLLERLEDLLARARAARMPIVFLRNCGGPGDPDVRDTPGWELHPSMSPANGDRVFDKTTCDAFESTPLGDELNSRGIQRVIVAGLQSEFCIRETSLGALNRGLAVTLVSDGHSTYDGGGKSAAEISAAVNAELDGRAKLERAMDIALA